jgi:anti-sigma factor RsiW
MSADTQRWASPPRADASSAGHLGSEREGTPSSAASACDGIRGLIFRTCEGEASPEEAMRLARHLPDCTRCRILMARERRLARMLELDLEDMPVGEDFVRSVMANLPGELPPEPEKRRARTGLKLAGFSGLLALIGLQSLQLLQGLQTVSERAFPSGNSPLPGLDAFLQDTTLRGVFEIAGWVLIALQSMGGSLGPLVPSLPTLAWSVGGLLVFAVGITLLGLGAVVVFAARALTA